MNMFNMEVFMNILNNKFFKYVFFAIVTSLLNVGTYLLFYNFILENILISNIVAYAVSITISFILNKKVVFKNDGGNIIKQIIFYLLVKLASFTIDSFVLVLCKEYIGLSNFIAKLIANMSTTISNYTLNQKMVFKENNK